LFSDARRACYLDLADDAAKGALFALAAGGWRVSAFAGGVILTEVEAVADLKAKAAEAEGLAGRGVGEVLGMPAHGVRGGIVGRW
jgi:hypothetical protein